LLSIKPQYAEAIFRGEKRYEYRRTPFRKPVDVVVVYITSPVGLVVGEFDVEEIISDAVPGLWKRTKTRAGIDRALFFDYFGGCRIAHAIVIGDVRRYAQPFGLDVGFGVKAPQSFLYLGSSTTTKRK
jgi:predicted transcriptional regulator